MSELARQHQAEQEAENAAKEQAELTDEQKNQQQSAIAAARAKAERAAATLDQFEMRIDLVSAIHIKPKLIDILKLEHFETVTFQSG